MEIPAMDELLMLAHEYQVTDRIAGCYLSEKLDGHRAYWDSAGGLWTRGGNRVAAPEAWLSDLPYGVPLDGELWLGRGQRDTLASVVRRRIPSAAAWERVSYMMFDSPPPMRDGCVPADTVPFSEIVSGLPSFVRGHVRMIPQERLPAEEPEARARLDARLAGVSAVGGEGLMLRNPHSAWRPGRTRDLLKVKLTARMSGRVIGYLSGREGKLRGMLGALLLRVNDRGGVLRLSSGLSLSDRAFPREDMSAWALGHPGVLVPDWVCSARFPRGVQVSFTYHGLSRHGVPREAAYREVGG